MSRGKVNDGHHIIGIKTVGELPSKMVKNHNLGKYYIRIYIIYQVFHSVIALFKMKMNSNDTAHYNQRNKW